jgi:hypothetical protein
MLADVLSDTALLDQHRSNLWSVNEEPVVAFHQAAAPSQTHPRWELLFEPWIPHAEAQ